LLVAEVEPLLALGISSAKGVNGDFRLDECDQAETVSGKVPEADTSGTGMLPIWSGMELKGGAAAAGGFHRLAMARSLCEYDQSSDRMDAKRPNGRLRSPAFPNNFRLADNTNREVANIP
jgi:hypothetical protein